MTDPTLCFEECEQKVANPLRSPSYEGRPFATRWFTFSAEMIVRGTNTLSVKLTGSDPEAKQDTIIIDEIEIFVEPT